MKNYSPNLITNWILLRSLQSFANCGSIRRIHQHQSGIPGPTLRQLRRLPERTLRWKRKRINGRTHPIQVLNNSFKSGVCLLKTTSFIISEPVAFSIFILTQNHRLREDETVNHRNNELVVEIF